MLTDKMKITLKGWRLTEEEMEKINKWLKMAYMSGYLRAGTPEKPLLEVWDDLKNAAGIVPGAVIAITESR